MKTAIFLGAGASKAEGAPLQNDLFKEYFKYASEKNVRSSMHGELVTFFDALFNIDVLVDDLDGVKFPTYEEVLGILDLAIIRDETYINYDLENIASNSGRIRELRKYFVLLMAEIIDYKLLEYKNLHDKLVNTLYTSNNAITNTIFISTNYDILIDNALSRLFVNSTHIDYGIDLMNFDMAGDWLRPNSEAIKLYKIHGSLNWLRCSTCNKVLLTQGEKGVVTRLLHDISQSSCPFCNSILVPVIVPPTYFKDMSNYFLSTVWSKIEHALQNVEHIIFCGYSFPDADIHLKYILKRVQINRTRNNLRVTVINNHYKKKKQIKDDEEARYNRFFGNNVVHYTNLTFKQFVDNPIKIIERL